MKNRRRLLILCNTMIFTTLASTGIASTVTVPNIITAIPTRANSFTQYGAAVSNQNDIVNIDFGNKDIIIDKKSMTNIHGKPNGNGRLVVSGKSFNLSKKRIFYKIIIPNSMLDMGYQLQPLD